MSSSGRIDEIRLLKTWRTLHGLRFPSFYLEMAALDALRYALRGNVAVNVLRCLEYLRDKIEFAREIFGFVEMLVFIALVLVGFFYIWKKGALDWSREDPTGRHVVKH